MRLGLELNRLGRPDDIASRAASLGYHSVWSAEATASDVFVPLACADAQVPGIHLGTTLTQVVARSPAATAMAAVTLDLLSGGRFVLGLGSSGPHPTEGWFGQPYGPVLHRLREYVEILRRSWWST